MKAGKATLVATLSESPSAESLRRLAAEAEWLELRADLTGDVSPDFLRSEFPGRLLYTLRSAAEGGRGETSAEERAGRLVAAAAGFDAVDLEAERDLHAEVLAGVPQGRRVVSWHGSPLSTRQLEERFATMRSTPALLYKLVPAAGSPGEDVAALGWLDATRRDDVALFVGGESGAWTRLLAPRLGAPWIYLAAGVAAAPGQPSLERWRRDYGLPRLAATEALFGVIGRPAQQSLSPRLHNAAYREQGLPYLYVVFEPESFADFWLELAEGDGLETLGAPLRGLSVTAPFKEAALAVAGATSPLAERVGAVNTLVWKSGVWEGDTTDPEGVVATLRQGGVTIARRPAAVLGCGAAGRSAAAGLLLAGAEVTLFNRSAARGARAAAALGLRCFRLDRFEPEEFEIIVHATSLGRSADDPLPLRSESLAPGTAVVDLVYRDDGATGLTQAARQRGAVVFDGRVVLWHQARGQYRRMTGRDLPMSLAASCLGLELGGERGEIE